MLRRDSFVCINYWQFLVSSCWETNVYFISVLSERPPTVWLVTAGSGPHILGTQLPCRHVLSHTHTHTSMHQANRNRKAEHLNSLAAETYDHISVVWQKPCICKNIFQQRTKECLFFHWSPCVFRYNFTVLVVSIKWFQRIINGHTNAQLRMENNKSWFVFKFTHNTSACFKPLSILLKFNNVTTIGPRLTQETLTCCYSEWSRTRPGVSNWIVASH